MKRILLLIIVSIIFSSLSYAMVYDKLNGLNYNDDLYEMYGIEVYGDHADVPDNDFERVDQGYYSLLGETGEYRYHGYDRNFNPYTNQRFPDDERSMVRLENKRWIREGWTSAGYSADLYNRFITANDNEKERNYLREAYRQMLPFQLWQVEEVDRYLYIETFPTIIGDGEGVMWHQGTDRIWYQTFSLNRLEHKLQTPVALEIESCVIGQYDFDSGSQTVDLTLNGMLLDDPVYRDEVRRHLYYQREDIACFVFEINGVEYVNRVNVGFNEASGNFKIGIGDYHKQQGFMDLDLSMHVEYLNGEHSMTENLSQRIDLGQEEYLLSYFNTSNIMVGEEISLEDIAYHDLSKGRFDEAVVTLTSGGKQESFLFGSFIDGQVVKSAILEFIVQNELSVHDAIRITQEISGYLGTSIHSERVELISLDQGIELSLQMPKRVFDLERIEAVNLTDMGHVAESALWIDGQPVDFNYFFSGQYRMGPIDRDRLMKVEVEMTTDGGTRYAYTDWIEVLTTKVQINFKQVESAVEERPVEFVNLEEVCNREELLSAYPPAYRIEVEGLVGEDEAGCRVLPSEPGVYPMEIWADNGIRQSYLKMHLVVHEDVAPVYQINLVDNQIYRGEKLRLLEDAYSPDGDAIIRQEICIEADLDLDGIFESSEVYDAEKIYDQLGMYRLVAEVEEENRSSETVREFTVDNRSPIATLSFEQVNQPPGIDVVIVRMGDADYQAIEETVQTADEWTKLLKSRGYDAEVGTHFDGKIILDRAITTLVGTGDVLPPEVYHYAEEGFEGLLELSGIENFGYYEDQGEYESKTSCKTVPVYEFIRSCEICGTYINPIGYRMCKFCTVVTGTATECTTRKIWIPDIVWIDDYQGCYTGTVHKEYAEDFEYDFRDGARKVIIIENGDENDRLIWENQAEEVYLGEAADIEALFPFVEEYPHIALIGEDFQLFSGYFDFEDDPIIRRMFMVHHEKGDLEAVVGGYPFQDQWQWDAPERLLLPGYYTIQARVWDQVMPDVFSKSSNEAIVTVKVHRPPVADFRLEQTPSLRLLDFSYDPDYENSHPNRGIEESRIEIVSGTGERWFQLPDTLEPGNYLFDYSVKDVDGAWTEVSRHIEIIDQPLQISAVIRPEEVSIDESVLLNQIVIRGAGIYAVSFDLMKGSRLVKPLRTELAFLSPEGRAFADLKAIIPDDYVDGAYAIRIKATDYFNPDEFNSRYFLFDIYSPIDLKVKPLGLVQEGQLAVVEATAAEYVRDVKLVMDDGKLDMVQEEGVWRSMVVVRRDMQLSVEAVLNNKMDMQRVDYAIDDSKGGNTLSITGKYNYWRGQVNIFGERMASEPDRFMGYEKATIAVIGDQEETDPYLYFDPRLDTKPVKMRYDDDRYLCDWIIPLASSTLSRDDDRLSDPYWIRAEIKGEVLEAYFDITGNIYDRLHLEPEIN